MCIVTQYARKKLVNLRSEMAVHNEADQNRSSSSYVSKIGEPAEGAKGGKAVAEKPHDFSLLTFSLTFLVVTLLLVERF